MSLGWSLKIRNLEHEITRDGTFLVYEDPSFLLKNFEQKISNEVGSNNKSSLKKLISLENLVKLRPNVKKDCSRAYLEKNFRLVEDRSKESISELYWGICVPAVCTPQDVEDVVSRVLAVAFTESRLKLTPRIPKGFCSDKIVSSVKTV
ncbi:hypothetical protein M0802_000186 [Mischocyttarus mexicanus]|nr:hypothetical protein M0802_000186 [Mischocyttarus mexicanus]